jgi:hypothetical protein
MGDRVLLKRKSAFERQGIAFFGKDFALLLKGFKDGYQDDTANAMWIGFNAGIEYQKNS